MGITVDYVKIFSANDKDSKVITSDNFSLFLNFKDDIFYDEITSDFDISDLSHSHRKILKNEKKSKKEMLSLARYKHFISPVYQGKLKNSYLLNNFCIVSIVKLNKNIKENLLPQVDLNLVFGGHYETGSGKIVVKKGQTFALMFQQQQLLALLKFFEYSGHYTKYQDLILETYRENKFDKALTDEYIKTYVQYRNYKDDPKLKGKQRKIEELNIELLDIEMDYTFDAVAPIRSIAFEKHLIEVKKKAEQMQIDQKGKHKLINLT
jgi:hypothetical protein